MKFRKCNVDFFQSEMWLNVSSVNVPSNICVEEASLLESVCSSNNKIDDKSLYLRFCAPCRKILITICMKNFNNLINL